jgi:hypothetical protein
MKAVLLNRWVNATRPFKTDGFGSSGWWQDGSGELGSNRRSSATQNRSKEVKESGCVERMDQRNQAFPNQK